MSRQVADFPRAGFVPCAARCVDGEQCRAQLQPILRRLWPRVPSFERASAQCLNAGICLIFGAVRAQLLAGCACRAGSIVFLCYIMDRKDLGQERHLWRVVTAHLLPRKKTPSTRTFLHTLVKQRSRS